MMASTQHEVAYEHIKSRIINLQFKPGQVLMDSKIASELNLSRTPVREAFLRLKSEGLVEYEPHKGWRVYLLTLNDLREIFGLMAAIEGLVARDAAGSTDPALAQDLRSTFIDLINAPGTNSPEAWFEADSRLHAVLCKMAKNERAFKIMTSLNEQWHRLRIGFMLIQGRKDRTIGEYRAMIDCILAGEGDEAERLARIHLANIHDELEQLLVSFVLPFVEEGV